MRPFSILIKPTGPDCNIACKYCFYSHKSSLFGECTHRMNDELLEKLIKDYLSLDFSVSSFAWQGGEPTLMGLSFYKKVIQLQSKYGKDGQIVSNALQTNGLLLDDKWCEFLNENNFLVGISLDGPQKYHDYYRVDNPGRGTFGKVMAAIENCRKYKVDFNILTLLNDKNVVAPDELFDFFIDNNFKYLQFVPCIEKDGSSGEIAHFSITPQQYSNFLRKMFDRWLEYGPEKLSIRIFDSILNYIVHGQPSECTFARRCNDYMVIEHNGDAFCCDFFVEEKYRLGNILETPVAQLINSEKKQQFASQKNKLHNKCFICRHIDVCRGGCLKDRLAINDDFKNPSYFCDTYKEFFDYCLPKLLLLAAKFNSERNNHSKKCTPK